MKLYYVKIYKDWDELDIEDSVIFELPTGTIEYEIREGEDLYLRNHNGSNSEIFSKLEKNGGSYVKSIVGYDCTGFFPEVKSIYDLKKVIKALDDECVKKFGMPEINKFKVGDTVKILDRVGDENNYSPIYANSMLKYAGTLTTIKNITGAGSLILDNNEFIWDQKTVKLVNEDKYIHPSELKDGDFIKISNNDIKGLIYIFKEYKDGDVYRHACFDLEYSDLNIVPSGVWRYFKKESDKITYATEEEKNLLNKALLKEGYIWNNTAKQLQKVDTITINDSTGIIDISKEHCISDCVSRVNPVHIPSHTKYGVFVDTDKEELNLFPTKKHYQLNFNY